MSRLPATVVGTGVMALIGVFASLDCLLPAQLPQARVTKVIGEMILVPEQRTPRPASVNDDVLYGTRVRMGTRARGELIFADQALARLGADTIFSLKSRPGVMELDRGVMLLEVPKGVEYTKINSGVATSAISGTVMLKYDLNYLTLIVLQGKARLSLEGAPRKVVVLGSGQISVSKLRAQPAELGDPLEIDLKRLMDTSRLVKEFPRLASQDLIDKQVQRQSKKKTKGELVGSSTLADMLADNLSTVDQASTARFATLESVTQTVLPPVTPSPTPVGSPSPSPTPGAAGSFGAKKSRVATDGLATHLIARPNKGPGIRRSIRDAMQTDRNLRNLLRTGHRR